MATSSALEGMTEWRDIPRELQDMMLCHVCNQQAFEMEPSVVLPCAHVMCVECMQKRLDQTASRDTVPCPLCGALWKLPYGDILGFPTDVFSRVLNNSLLGRSIGLVRPNPKCALHPKEDVDKFCKSCSVTVCQLCCDRYHKDHMKRIEPIEAQRQRLNYEFTDLENNLHRKQSQIDDVIEGLKREETKMTDDIHWVTDKINREAEKKAEEITEEQSELRRRGQSDIDELAIRQEEIKREAEEKIKQLIEQQKKIEDETQQKIDTLNVSKDKLQEDVQKRLRSLTFDKHRLEREFRISLQTLQKQKESVQNDQVFVEILNNMGNESDKLARLPGMKNTISAGKILSSRKLGLQTVRWQFDVNKNEVDLSSLISKIRIAESVVESLGDDGESLFPGLHDAGTIPVSCKPAWETRSAGLFGQQHILHACVGDNADKLCLHNIPRAATHLIPIPGMKWCGASVVVDGAAGEIVAADQVRGWTDEMTAGKSQTHLSGSLHWLTLSHNYNIINHEKTPLQCVQRDYMNVDHVGHVLVLTLCTTSQHPRQLILHDNNRCVLRTISLPDLFVDPFSAVSFGNDTFVVVDVGKNQVIWIDQHGQVLQQYGQQPGEKLNQPVHIIQHSKGSLLIADWGNHKVHLVSNEAKLLQVLMKDPVVQYPFTLHLDEQAGLLCVVQWQDANNVKVRTFKFLPCTIHIKQVCLSVLV